MLANALCQPAHPSLIHRFREQARSHICNAFQIEESASNSSVIELLAALLLHQRLLNRRLMHFIGVLFTGFRQDAQP